MTYKPCDDDPDYHSTQPCEDPMCFLMQSPYYIAIFEKVFQELTDQGFGTSLLLIAQGCCAKLFYVSEAQVALGLLPGYRMVRTADDLLIEKV